MSELPKIGIVLGNYFCEIPEGYNTWTISNGVVIAINPNKPAIYFNEDKKQWEKLNYASEFKKVEVVGSDDNRGKV